MRFAWLEELLPHAAPKPRTQLLWLLFFALFPLAYIGGIMLETAEESPAMMSGFEDRSASIRTAQLFAASKGYPVAAWHQYAIAKTDNSLVAFYSKQKDAAITAISGIAPAQQVEVLFRSPDQTHEFRTFLSLTGQVIGFDFGKSKGGIGEKISFGIGSVTTTGSAPAKSDDESSSMKNAIDISDADAETIARDALSGNPALRGFIEKKKPSVGSSDSDSAERDVKWNVTPANNQELTLTISAGVRDGEVVSQRIEASLDRKHELKEAAFQAGLQTVYYSFLSFGIVFAIIRYAKRTLQKEVSHARTLLVAALFVVSYGTLTYSAYIDLVAMNVNGATFSKIGLAAYITGLISFCLMGLLVAIAYGSGEGEVREAYPGKLTSLDALLAGRIFSRNVGGSLLFGAAAAGWLLLFHHAFSHFMSTDISATRNDVLTITFARLPWLTLLVGRQYDSLLIAVTGLLLPGAFLLRRRARSRRRYAWLILFAVLSVTRDASKFPTVESTLLAVVVLVCALLLPFFACDVLAAMVSLSALSFVEELTRLNAVFPSWNALAHTLAAVAVLILVGAAYCALRGFPVREEDVGPRYAKNLAQRMSLQAEVHAAREAQLRLLPQEAPQLPGIQIAACCLPARDVGGDFYDFFLLDAHRVGIFVAQGGDQGLASALCIALAKGVLMHSSRQPHPPAQTLVDLEASLGELLEGGSIGRISFLYALVDTGRNILSYARMGDSPSFVAYRQATGIAPTGTLERIIPSVGRPRNAPPIYEGSATTAIGDFLVFYTKGVTNLRSKRFRRRDYQWMDVLIPLLGNPPAALQTSLAAALAKHQNHASDDLTAVVLRVLQSNILPQEVVA